METQKQTEQRWGYNHERLYYLNLSNGAKLYVNVSCGVISYDDIRNKKYLEFASFDRETSDVTADVSIVDGVKTETKTVTAPQKILDNKDLFLNAPGLSRPARTLAHIIFEAIG